MEKYKCLKGFVVDAYDENGNLIENESLVVKQWSVWEKQKYSYISDIRLINENREWLEVCEEHLKSDFIKMK